MEEVILKIKLKKKNNNKKKEEEEEEQQQQQEKENIIGALTLFYSLNILLNLAGRF